MIEGVVIKGVASRFTTDTEEGIKECFARGKLKKDGDIRVGDRVLIQKEGKDFGRNVIAGIAGQLTYVVLYLSKTFVVKYWIEKNDIA